MGQPLANQTVALVQGETTLDTEVTDATGYFRFGPLSPGAYTVAVDATPPEQWADPEPQAVTVAAGETRSLDFTVPAPGDGPPTGVKTLFQWWYDHHVFYPQGSRCAGLGGEQQIASTGHIILADPAGEVGGIVRCVVSEEPKHCPDDVVPADCFVQSASTASDFPTLPSGTRVWAAPCDTSSFHNGQYRITIEYDRAGWFTGMGTSTLTVACRNCVVSRAIDAEHPDVFRYDPTDPSGDAGRTKRKFRVVLTDVAKRPIGLDLAVFALHRELPDDAPHPEAWGAAIEHLCFDAWTTGDWSNPVVLDGEWDAMVASGPENPQEPVRWGLYPWRVAIGHDPGSGYGMHNTASPLGLYPARRNGLLNPIAELLGLSEDGSAYRFRVNYGVSSPQVDNDGTGRTDDDAPELGGDQTSRLVLYDPDLETTDFLLDQVPCETHGENDGRFGPQRHHELVVAVPTATMAKQGKYAFAVDLLDVHADGNKAHAPRQALATGQYWAQLDLDVDSDNTNGFSPPELSAAEDAVEDLNNDAHPGKVALVQDGDLDQDAIQDLFDGFNCDARLSPDNQCAGLRFVPVVLHTAGLKAAARLRIAYPASDPQAVTASLTAPFVLPEVDGAAQSGTGRLWLRNGGEPRSAASVTAGGDFLPPGEYTAEELGLLGAATKTLYYEAVTPSRAVGGVEITVSLDPTGTEGFCAQDQVCLTNTAIALEGTTDAASPDWQTVHRLVASDLSMQQTGEDDDDLVGTDVTAGPYEINRLAIDDPRVTLTQCQIDGLVRALSLDELGRYVSEPWTPVRDDGVSAPPPGPVDGPWLPFVAPLLPLAGGDITAEYNPLKLFGDELPESASRADRIMAGLAKKAVNEIRASGVEIPANDTGFVGRAAEARIADRLAGRRRWATGIVVDTADPEGIRVLAVNGLRADGTPFNGNLVSHVQIDAVCLEHGKSIRAGNLWRADDIKELYEIKNSIDGRLTSEQALKLEALVPGRELKCVGGTEWRYQYSQKRWIVNDRWKKATAVLAAIGLGRSAYAYVRRHDYDTEFAAIVAIAEDIAMDTVGDALDRRVRVITELLPPLRQYLQHYDPTEVTDVAVGVAAYRILTISEA